MKKFKVTVPYAIFVTLEVEAEDAEAAEEEACSEIHISGYCGNGSTDKLIGVTKGSIEAGECPIEGAGFSIEVEEV